MFIGEYKHLIDEKGRLAVPAKFRVGLKGGAVVTKGGFENCLVMYSISEWKELAEKLAKLPMSQSNPRDFSRLTFSSAKDESIDKQGRMLIADDLRKFAGIDKKVAIIGLYNRIEIWDEAKWEGYKEATEKQRDEIAKKMAELGI